MNSSTDVWALGCCLYSLAFLQNCFEEGSNLAILSRNYKIPDDNPYGDDLVELIDRMLTVDNKARADMTEVILCLSAIYSGRPLPPRKKVKTKTEEEAKDGEDVDDDGERVGHVSNGWSRYPGEEKEEEEGNPKCGKSCLCQALRSRASVEMSDHFHVGQKISHRFSCSAAIAGVEAWAMHLANLQVPLLLGVLICLKPHSQHLPVDLPTAGSDELAFSTDTSNFADAGGESGSAAFGSFDGVEKRDAAKNRFDAFAGSGAWGNEQAAQIQSSGTVTADGFPAAFSGAGADNEQSAADNCT